VVRQNQSTSERYSLIVRTMVEVGWSFASTAMAHLYGRLRRAAPPQTHRQIGEPNTESEPSTIERAAAEPEHGTRQSDACDPEAQGEVDRSLSAVAKRTTIR
jgi:hypothetical protein